ncbi:MAG: InlB B-repeat-containing protein, partial [Treponema sp.]|nr:InlB B-repeat-containing protein [Treponema sp.]
SPEEAGSHVVQFITSNVSGVSVVATPIKYVRPPAVKIDALPATPTRSPGSWTFLGWYDTAATEGGLKFSADTAIDRDWKLYTRWFNGTPATIRFNPNGGTIEGSPSYVTRTVTPPDKTVLDWPPNPDPPGANPFSGWYTEQFGGVEFTPATEVAYSVTTTVYAQYGDKYTVTFDNNGGTTEANPTTMSVFGSGTTLSSLPTPPTKTDKVFGGWYDTPATSGGSQFTTGTGITHSITVYARWNNPPPCTISFDRQGGAGSNPTAITVEYKDPVGTLPVPTASRTTLTFAGWYTTPKSGGVKYEATTLATTSLTLYARWKGLVLWYKFARSSATITDASKDMVGTAHNGTLRAGGASGASLANHTANTNPKVENATINGKTVPVMTTASSSTSPHLDMGAAVGTDIIQHLDEEFTIAAFIITYQDEYRTVASFLNTLNLTSASAVGGLFLTHTRGNEGFGITKTSTAAAQTLRGNYTSSNTMTHIAYTQTGRTGPNNGKLYINGVLQKEGTFTILPADLGATANNFLGRPYNNSDAYMGYPSSLGDFRIYNRALTATEITALKNATDY